MGIHPEGTRGKGDDPYNLLRPQPGVGIILSRSTHSHAVPIFITGLSNKMAEEFKKTWFRPRDTHPIDVWFGRPLDLSELRKKGERLAVQMEIAKTVMGGIEALATAHKAEAARES